MKKTLLKMTQDILNSLDGEEINDIGDTVESRQIVTFIRNSYEDIVASLDLPELYGPCQLQNFIDVTNPVIMTIPNNVSKVNWVKYDASTVANPGVGYQEVVYMNLEDFLIRMFGSDLQDSNVQKSQVSLASGTIDTFYRNDRAPGFYTVLDDKTVLFDSYDSSMENTLMGRKSICFGQIIPQFIETNLFVPFLDADQFPLLENEAKNQAFAEQKQTQSPIAVQRSRKGWIRSQRTKVRMPNDNNYNLNSRTNYGRHAGRTISNWAKNGW